MRIEEIRIDLRKIQNFREPMFQKSGRYCPHAKTLELNIHEVFDKTEKARRKRTGVSND